MNWSGVWDGAWDQAWNGPIAQAVAGAPPSRGRIARVYSMYAAMQAWPQIAARLARATTYGTLQQIGPIVIDLIGPMRVYRGDSVTYRITVTDDSDPPARVNLTGVAIELEVKALLGGPDPAPISKTVGAGISLLAQSGATLGQADATIASSDTDITPGIYWLDVVTIAAGIRTHVIEPRMFTIDPVVNAP